MATHELRIHRTNYTAIITLDGAAQVWTWEIPVIPPTNAIEHHVSEDGANIYYRTEEGGDWYVRECTRRPMTPTMLLAQLTFTEARELLGYCQHLTDQLGTHLGFVHVAMGEALAVKNWPALRSLLSEMHEALGARAIAAETGRLAYTALEHEPVN